MDRRLLMLLGLLALVALLWLVVAGLGEGPTVGEKPDLGGHANSSREEGPGLDPRAAPKSDDPRQPAKKEAELADGQARVTAQIRLPAADGGVCRYLLEGPGGKVLAEGRVPAGSFEARYARPATQHGVAIRFDGPRGATVVRSVPQVDTDLGEIVLVPRLAYAGVALNPSGDPLQGVRIDLLLDGVTTYGTSPRTEADGRFLIPLHTVTIPMRPTQDGSIPRWTLSVRTEGRASYAAVPARVDGLRNQHRAVFRETPGTSLRIVHADTRAPVVGAEVHWSPLSADSLTVDPRSRRDLLAQRGRSDDEGIVPIRWPERVVQANVRVVMDGRDVRVGVQRRDLVDGEPLEVRVPARGRVLELVCVGLADGSEGALLQIYLRRADGREFVRHLVETDADGRAKIELGASPSFDPGAEQMHDRYQWIARHTGAGGVPRYEQGSGTVERIPDGWKTEIQLDASIQPAIRPVWVRLPSTVHSVGAAPGALTIVVMPKEGGPHQFTGYAMVTEPVRFKGVRAYPFQGIDATKLQSFDRFSLDWIRASVRLRDGTLIAQRVQHDALMRALQQEEALDLTTVTAPAIAPVRVIDGKNAAVAHAVVSVMPEYADGGGSWSETRLQARTDEEGRCVLELPDTSVACAVGAFDPPTGRRGFATVPAGETKDEIVVRVSEVDDLSFSVELPKHAEAGRESFYLVARPSWLAPRIACTRAGDAGSWTCRASLRGYRLVGYVRVRDGRKHVMHFLDVAAEDAQGARLSNWKRVGQ